MISSIATADDWRLEPYRHVGDPVWLRERDLFVAEGRLVVQRLIELRRFAIASVLVNRAARAALDPQLSALDAGVYVCDDEVLEKVTGFNFHRGCLALASRPAPAPPDDLLGATRLLALERVSNPDNVGGLFRTAAAFGVEGILLSPASGDPFYRKAIRTSMGAALRLSCARVDGWPAGLEAFRRGGFTIAALTPHPQATPVAEFAAKIGPGDRMILLVGAEGAGLSPATLACADVRLRIPIDTSVDSLNVVVAAGIALHRLSPGGAQLAPVSAAIP